MLSSVAKFEDFVDSGRDGRGWCPASQRASCHLLFGC